MSDLVYMDNAATTCTSPEVLKDMLPYYLENYGNPSSIYSFSDNPRMAIRKAREQIAVTINASPEDIYFTAGGSEADNWAVISTARKYRNKGNHIITSRIEHHAMLHSCEYLEKCGFRVTYIDVDKNGVIRLDMLERAIRKETILISVMFANNEIGTIQPIDKIGEIAGKYGVLFHTDAVQAYGQVPIDVKSLNIDMLSASGHKFNGPKGTGFLYIRNGVDIGSFINGGAQESGKRAGTENVPGIVGIGKAAELSSRMLEEKMYYETELRDYMINRVLSEIPYTRVNGHINNRLPNNANFSFDFVDGEALLIMLDSYGICSSTGSACSAGSKSPSHVLMAIGLSEEAARGSLRLTISQYTTKKEIDYVCDILKSVIEKLRLNSPSYEDYINKNN